MQQTFLEEVSVKTLFWYPGSKRSAIKRIVPMVPSKVTEMVSPFIGSGAIELVLAGRGIRVHGYDYQWELANCWQHMLADGRKLAEWCQQTLLSYTRDELTQIFIDDYKVATSDFERAGYHWLRLSLSYRGILSKSGGLCYYDVVNGRAVYRTKSGLDGKTVLTNFDRLSQFRNDSLTVNAADYEESLSRHPELFAYMDPPYAESAAGQTLYGASAELDSKFDHARLAEVLFRREAPFILSYKNNQLIRDLYPEDDYDWTYQDWYQQAAETHRVITDEAIIRPRRYLDFWRTDNGK